MDTPSFDLKSLVVDVKSAWIDYPGLDGFKVNIAHIAREKLVKIRKNCLETTFDRRTRTPVESLNDQKFLREFVQAAVLDWKGLTFAYLDTLLPVDVSKQDPKAELPFSLENAVILASQSTDFDTWISEVVYDLENFRSI